MSYNNGNYGPALRNWPVMAFPTAAMRAYAQNDASQNGVGPAISTGGAEFIGARIGRRRGIMLSAFSSGGPGGFTIAGRGPG